MAEVEIIPAWTIVNQGCERKTHLVIAGTQVQHPTVDENVPTWEDIRLDLRIVNPE